MRKMKKFNILMSLCVLVFTGFIFYDTRIIRGFDDAIREFVLSLRNSSLNEIVLAFTYAGEAEVLGSLCIAGVIGLFFLRKWLSGVLLLASIGISYGLNLGLKSAFGRERPLENRLLEEDGFSFPSGNAMVGTTFYLFAAFLLYQRFQKSWILWLGVLLPFLLSLSRVYVGVHYPSDILAGFSIGMALCLGLVVVYKSLNNRGTNIQKNKNAAV
jgi:undecaprenyl-diphosphatase